VPEAVHSALFRGFRGFRGKCSCRSLAKAVAIPAEAAAACQPVHRRHLTSGSHPSRPTPIIIYVYVATINRRREANAAGCHAERGRTVTTPESSEEGSGIQVEIAQRRPFHSVKAEIAVSILRTAALIERHFAQVVARTGLTTQQYNVLRILRGAGTEGLPTLVIRDRMIHEAPGITRLLDKLEKAGLARRERTASDRRQVFCYITDRGLAIVDELDEEMRAADDVAVGNLSESEQKELLKLLERVRARSRSSKKG
jgi:MarR family transcriptional regulator, organic hydroperoxide resistance regulator